MSNKNKFQKPQFKKYQEFTLAEDLVIPKVPKRVN